LLCENLEESISQKLGSPSKDSTGSASTLCLPSPMVKNDITSSGRNLSEEKIAENKSIFLHLSFDNNVHEGHGSSIYKNLDKTVYNSICSSAETSNMTSGKGQILSTNMTCCHGCETHHANASKRPFCWEHEDLPDIFSASELQPWTSSNKTQSCNRKDLFSLAKHEKPQNPGTNFDLPYLKENPEYDNSEYLNRTNNLREHLLSTHFNNGDQCWSPNASNVIPYTNQGETRITRPLLPPPGLVHYSSDFTPCVKVVLAILNRKRSSLSKQDFDELTTYFCSARNPHSPHQLCPYCKGITPYHDDSELIHLLQCFVCYNCFEMRKREATLKNRKRPRYSVNGEAYFCLVCFRLCGNPKTRYRHLSSTEHQLALHHWYDIPLASTYNGPPKILATRKYFTERKISKRSFTLEHHRPDSDGGIKERKFELRQTRKIKKKFWFNSEDFNYFEIIDLESNRIQKNQTKFYFKAKL